MELIKWFGIWFLIWGAYNMYFKWKIDAVRNDTYFLTSLYFFISSIIALVVFYKYVIYWDGLIFAFLATLFLGIFFTNYYPFIKHIKNGKYFLITLSFSILLQQIMVGVGVEIWPKIFGLIFMLGHFPVIFFKWANFRYLFLILALIGGASFSYLITNYANVGVATSYIIHYCFYIPIFYYLRDERNV